MSYNFNWWVGSQQHQVVGSAEAKSISVAVYIYKGLHLQGGNKVYTYKGVR